MPHDRRLLDTDVVIEYLRGRPAAIPYLEGLRGDLLLSTITVAELYAGVRGRDEQNALERFTGAFRLVPVSRNIAERGGLFRRDYGPSHGLGLADALIAATAVEEDARLVTFNRKHFPMLARVEVPWER